MPKDCKNLQGIEHRYWHNLYGMYMQSATADGLTTRTALTPTPSTTAGSLLGGISSFLMPSKPPTDAVVTVTPSPQRPFVLSRAFWAGSQRYGAIWTGDNAGTWEHLRIAAPMLLSISIAGLPFAGADVGGFFQDPSAELFTRWYQAGSFTPFFRGHAHHDTKRREPWVFGEPYTTILRDAAMVRYALLPYWYSVFYESYRYGLPIMRPMFTEFPDDSKTYAIDNQWMVGSGLLVCPVTHEGAVEAQVYFPSGSGPWYDYYTYVALASVAPGGEVRTVSAPLEKLPVFICGG